MTITPADAKTIAGLVTLIESILWEYEDAAYDQIDNLREKLAEISDIIEQEVSEFDATYSTESIREEAMQSEVYDPLKRIQDDLASSRYQ